MKKVIEIPKGATIEVKQDRVIIKYEEAFVPKNGDFCVIDKDYGHYRTLFISDGKIAKNGGEFSYHASKINTDFSTTASWPWRSPGACSS